MQKITPFLWFDGNAHDAASYYVSVFKNSKITNVVKNPPGAPGPVDGVMLVSFELDGEPFTAINGGPMFTFS